jgi:dolichyldiphosphatase
MSLLLRLAHSLIVIIGASIVAASRWYLRYHTPRQIFIGLGIGAFLGLAWHATVITLRSIGLVDWVLQVPVVEMLWFKDGDIGSLEHDLYEEWMVWKKQHDGDARKAAIKKGQ